MAAVSFLEEQDLKGKKKKREKERGT